MTKPLDQTLEDLDKRRHDHVHAAVSVSRVPKDRLYLQRHAGYGYFFHARQCRREEP